MQGTRANKRVDEKCLEMKYGTMQQILCKETTCCTRTRARRQISDLTSCGASPRGIAPAAGEATVRDAKNRITRTVHLPVAYVISTVSPMLHTVLGSTHLPCKPFASTFLCHLQPSISQGNEIRPEQGQYVWLCALSSSYSCLPFELQLRHRTRHGQTRHGQPDLSDSTIDSYIMQQ